MRDTDTDNMRSMMQMRDRSLVENAAYAMGALSDADQDAAVAMFNRIWGDRGRHQWACISIERSKKEAKA